MIHVTRRINRATHTLAAYELAAFPGKSSLLQRDASYTEALLKALVCDLEHYANHHGINFSAVVSTGRALNATEVVEDAPYKIGDSVRLTRQYGRCGTIIGWHTAGSDTETSFLIAVPGIPYIYAETAAHLAPAPKFPRTQTVLGTVRHADQAEQLYISIAARLPEAPTSTRHALEHDRQQLLTALSCWSGITETRLHDELASRASSNRQQPPDATAATANLPANTNPSLPATTPHTHEEKRQPSSPGPTPQHEHLNGGVPARKPAHPKPSRAVTVDGGHDHSTHSRRTPR